MPIVTIRMVSTSSEQSDSRLRERMLVGDLAALSEVFEYNHARFWHLVYFRMDVRLRSRIDPDDVLQDAFVAAESRLNHFVESENVSSAVWLRSIVLQTLVDLHRRHLETQARDASLALRMTEVDTKAVRREKDPSKRTLDSRTLRAQCVHMSELGTNTTQSD